MLVGKKRDDERRGWQFLMLVEGLEIPLEEGETLGGAFTTRTVRAASEELAIVAAQESVTAELVKFDRSVDSARLRITVVRSRPVPTRVTRKMPNRGFAFYPTDDEEGRAGALEIETKAHKWDE